MDVSHKIRMDHENAEGERGGICGRGAYTHVRG